MHAAHQEFFEATRVGKEYADNRVERSFYQRAVGYEYDLVKTVRRNKNGLTVTDTIKHVPGDVTAQMKWLCNRMPHKWRDKVGVSTRSGREMTAAQALDDLIALLIEHGVQRLISRLTRRSWPRTERSSRLPSSSSGSRRRRPEKRCKIELELYLAEREGERHIDRER